MPRPCAPNSGFSTSGASAEAPRAAASAAARPSTATVGGVGTPALGEQEGGHRLVDATLDGLGAVPDRHAEMFERMQDAQPPRHRLERAGGDRADEDRVGQGAAEAGERQARRAAAVERRRRRDRRGGRQRAASAQAGGQRTAGAPVPPSLRMRTRGITGPLPRPGCADHGLIRGSGRASSASRAPARKVSPLSIAVTITSAGLNSSGSMA